MADDDRPSAVPGQLTLDVATDLASVEAILGEWRALAAICARSPLDAPDWLYPVAKHYLAEYQTRVLTWRDETGRLVGVAPYSLFTVRRPLRPIRQLAMFGAIGPRLRGLVDVLALDEVRPAVLDSMAAWLRSNREWDVVHINRPAFGSPTPERLRTEASRAHWTYASFRNLRSTTYQVELPASVEEWERHLAPKDRRSLLSRRRRFEQRGGVFVPAIEASEIDQVLDTFEPLLTQRWGANEVYFRNEPRFAGLLHEAVPSLVGSGAAWISVARDQTGVVAAVISVAQNAQAMSLLMVARGDGEYREFSLGQQIHYVALGEAVRRGCHTFDLLWSGGYKETFWRAVGRDLEGAFIGRGFVGGTAARALARRENRVGSG